MNDKKEIALHCIAQRFGDFILTCIFIVFSLIVVPSSIILFITFSKWRVYTSIAHIPNQTKQKSILFKKRGKLSFRVF